MNQARSILEVRLRVPLDSFDLRVEHTAARHVTGLFGASGSGKTTFLETLAGLRPNATGYVRFGEEIWLDTDRGVRLPPERRHIGYVPQDHLLFAHKSVRGNLEAGKARALRAGLDFAAVAAHVINVLELEPLLDRRVTELSGGERQRVALGRALCSGPRLLLLDEPLAALDQRLRLRILPFLQRVRERFDLPILLVSHNPVEVQALCDELLALHAGRVIATGTPLEVLTRPEVVESSESECFQNMLAGVVASHELHTSTLLLGEGESRPRLVIPRIEAPLGTSILCGIPADEILISSEDPSGISARNRLPGRIESIQVVEHRRLVTVRVHPSLKPLVSEVTADAIRDLRLAEGSQAFLIFKTSSILAYTDKPQSRIQP